MSQTFEEAWATDERPPLSGLSQDELIAEFHRLDAIVKESGASRREIGMALAGIAYENKREQNTVHIESTRGERISVVFGIDYEYDVELMKDVLNLIGPEKFDSLFKTKLEFIPKKRELKGFLNTVSSDEQIETAKKIIKDATITKNKTPYVSVE